NPPGSGPSIGGRKSNASPKCHTRCFDASRRALPLRRNRPRRHERGRAVNAPAYMRRCRPYGPRVIEVAKFLAAEIGCDLVPFFLEVDRRWQGLTAGGLNGTLG